MSNSGSHHQGKQDSSPSHIGHAAVKQPGMQAEAAQGSEPEPEHSGNTVKRALKTRHVSMIALGGSIGTGLFVASGASIHSAGPGGALLAYAAIGLMVLHMLQSGSWYIS